jgi:hypothetical protein
MRFVSVLLSSFILPFFSFLPACLFAGARDARTCGAITALMRLSATARGKSYRKSSLISLISLIKLKNHIYLLTRKLQLDCNK